MSSGSTSPATRRRRTRWFAAKSAWRKGMRSTPSRSSEARDRINSLGYFQDKFEIKNRPGSAPDRVVLDANVEEKSTGELQLSAGYSSLEQFIIQANITQRNFRGKGQELRLGVNYSYYSKSVRAGLYRAVSVRQEHRRRRRLVPPRLQRVQLYRRYQADDVQPGVDRLPDPRGHPADRILGAAGALRPLSYDQVGLDQATYFNADAAPVIFCAIIAGRYLCEAARQSHYLVGRLHARLRQPQQPICALQGARASRSARTSPASAATFATYKTRADRRQILGPRLAALCSRRLPKRVYQGAGADRRPQGRRWGRITDRFYLGEPQFRGFDIRGVGPRVTRTPYTTDANGNQVLLTGKDKHIIDDALGGRCLLSRPDRNELPLGAGCEGIGASAVDLYAGGALCSTFKAPLPTEPNDSYPITINANGHKVLGALIRSQFCSGLGQQEYSRARPPRRQRRIALYQRGAGDQLHLTGYSATSGDDACTGHVGQIRQSVTTYGPYKEQFQGNSASPRLSIGIGVNWNSPFGPLRIDLAKALLTQPGDDPKLITFNVGTSF